MEGDMDSEEKPSAGIRELPKSTVRLIGSSQVITSVVSVVKELTENSLDAGATSIEIKLDNFGFDKVEVRDNGSGIHRHDTEYMAQPHYTSKISDMEDLQRVQTFGFRGEALGSLCCVSNVSITTMTKDDPHSTTYTINQHGQITAAKPSHLGIGTTVTSTNLFKNLPVRRQYYSAAKRRKEEMKNVEDLVIAMGIVNWGARLALRHNKSVVWQKNPAADVGSVLLTVFGAATMAQMEHVQRYSEDQQVGIEAFLPKPSAPVAMVTRSTNDRCFVYVNKRTVTLKDVEKILRQHCTKALNTDNSRYPLAFVHITLAPSEVDVNLDPNKNRVLIQDKESVLNLLSTILEELYDTRDKENVQGDQNQIKQSDHVAANEEPSSFSDNSQSLEESCSAPEGLTLLDNCSKRSSKNNDFPVIKPVSERNLVSGAHPVQPCGTSNQNVDTRNGITHEPTATQNTESFMTESSCKENSPEQITADVLKDFDEDFDMVSMFDVSTPNLERSRDFQPPLCSTQARTENICQKMDFTAIEHSGNASTGETWKDRNGNTPKLDAVPQEYVVHRETCPNNAVQLQNLSEARNTSIMSSVSESPSPVTMVTWSKGTALKDDEDKTIQPVQLHTVTLKQATSNPPRSRNTSLTVSSATKKRIVNLNGHNRTIQQCIKTQKPHPRKSRPSKDVKFCLKELQEKFTSDLKISQSENSTDKSLKLIGQLKSQGAWVCCQDNHLALFQPIRAQEEILYQRLLENHRLSTVLLENPKQISPEVLQSDKLWSTLLGMQTREAAPTDTYGQYTDPRLVDNGVLLRCKKEDGQPWIQLVEVASGLASVDIQSLCEILEVVTRLPAASLAETRPCKVRNYLQGEAVRMSRRLPAALCREDVEEVWRDIEPRLSAGRTSCSHGQPYFVPLYNMCDVTSSQDDGSGSQLTPSQTNEHILENNTQML